MSKISIKPFRAYRPPNNIAHLVACTPYNLINTQEAQIIAQQNKYSFLHVSRPEVDNTQSHVPYTHAAGEKGHKNLQHFIANGWLKKDPQQSLYVYKREHNNQSLTGIIGLISLQNYQDNLIKRHENTIKEKEDALTQFTKIQNAQVDPILLTYKASNDINTIINTHINAQKNNPTQDFFSSTGTHHTIWALRNPETLSHLQELFSKIPTLYIADGHHRSAAAHRLATKNTPNTTPNNYLLAALFPDTDIQLSEYNRVIHTIGKATQEKLLSHAHANFHVQKVSSLQEATPSQPGTFGMYTSNQWFKLITKARTQEQHVQTNTNPIDHLDISILTNKLLNPILALDNNPTSNAIEFVGGPQSMQKLEAKCQASQTDTHSSIAFAFHPVSINDLMTIVNTGQLMPPKTTWFEPKILPGLIVNILQN